MGGELGSPNRINIFFEFVSNHQLLPCKLYTSISLIMAELNELELETVKSLLADIKNGSSALKSSISSWRERLPPPPFSIR